MRRLILAATVTAATIVAGSAAQAMPVLPAGPQDTGIIRVEGGCGPGGHRTPYGRCVPNFYRPRPFYRACPPGMHINPYGRCRPNF